MKFLKVFALFFLFLIYGAMAQRYADYPYESRFAYGIFGDPGLNIYSADFKKLEPYPNCCLKFESGNGLHLAGGFFFIIPLSGKWEIDTRILYGDLSGLLTSEEDIAEILNPNTGGTIAGRIEHSLDARINTIGISPLFNYRFSDRFRFRLGFNTSIVVKADFTQKEKILSPDYAVFTDTKSKIRHEYSGEIPDHNKLSFSIVAGISYDFPMNNSRTLFFTPGINLEYGLVPVVKNLSWNTNVISGEIAVKYSPRKLVPPPPPVVPPVAPPMAPMPEPPLPPVLDASITAVGYDEGIEQDFSVIKVEEVLLRHVYPLLSYVFFDENSSKIPERFSLMNKTGAENFDFIMLSGMERMKVYRNILNIVGKRMIENPDAKIELTGCNCDFGPEKNNIKLSESRANTVKDYLQDIWGLEPGRINIKARGLPGKASKIGDPDGNAENRRVEITSDDENILSYLEITDTIRTSHPPQIRFKIRVNTSIGIEKWKVIVYQKGEEIRGFSGEGHPPAIIDWKIEEEDVSNSNLKFDHPINYVLITTDNDQKIWQSLVQTLPVQQVTIEQKAEANSTSQNEIQKFSLILFDFDEDQLDIANMRLVSEARKKLSKGARITITGYSDRTGSEDYNMKLSLRRAKTTASALGVGSSRARGVGESKIIYDNNTPEGRFYSRTVEIEIQK